MGERCQVWITGVGTATPLGHAYAGFADHLLAGRSGVRRVAGFITERGVRQLFLANAVKVDGQVPKGFKSASQ